VSLAKKSKSKTPAPLPETISSWASFYRVVRRIPRGRVCTYGAVAAMAGHPRHSRHVGYALAALKETGSTQGVPWQRILGKKAGERAAITIKDPVGAAMQRSMLEAEGVVFDEKGNVSLARFGWFEGPKRAKKTPAKKTRSKSY
jgi:methylated-DNA-protein-cysteine methyltransferase-like protein